MTEAPGRGSPDARPDRSGPLVGIVALLAVVVIGGTLAGPWHPPLRLSTPAPSPVPEPSITPFPIIPLDQFADANPVHPWDLRWLGVGLVLVMLAWAAYLVLRWLRRHPAPMVPEAPDDAGIELDAAFTGPGTVLPNLPRLRAGIAEAEEALRRFPRPVDAVIAAWVRLEHAAARSGVVRDPASTPTEFTVAVLDTAPVDPQATRTLLDLYLRARFGSDPMTPDDVAAAVRALSVLALGLNDPDDADTSDWRVGNADRPPVEPDAVEPDADDAPPDDVEPDDAPPDDDAPPRPEDAS